MYHNNSKEIFDIKYFNSSSWKVKVTSTHFCVLYIAGFLHCRNCSSTAYQPKFFRRAKYTVSAAISERSSMSKLWV